MKLREQKRDPAQPSKKRSDPPAQVEEAPLVRWAESGDDEAWHDGWGEDLGADEEPLFGDDDFETSEEPSDEAGEGDEDDEREESEETEEGESGDLAPVSQAADGDAEEGETQRGRRRSKTIARKQMLRERRRMLAQGSIPEIVEYDRPQFRSSCRDAERPCLYVSCRYHLYLDVNPMTGSIKLNFPDKEVWDLEETCALDVAERGGITLEEVGEIMNLTRERIRQVEVSGLEKLRAGDAALGTFVEGRELEGLPAPGKA